MSDRTNLWTFLLYPDDPKCPKNYLEIIDNWHIPTLLSPKHDLDLKKETGDEVKPHIHIMLYFGKGANKSINQLNELLDDLNTACTRKLEQVSCNEAMIRYFIHWDQPEKSHRSKGMDRDWKPTDLLSLSGFEYLQAFENYTTDKEIYNFIEELINVMMIFDLYDCIEYLKAHNMDYETMFLRKHIYYFEKYINSKYYRYKKKFEVDKNTGEIKPKFKD